jgi:DNA polymerase III epsilon subunit-like protein
MTYILCTDCETSGFKFKQNQLLSVGFIVADADTFEPFATKYLEIQFDDKKYLWSESAQDCHGLSQTYLKANGLSRSDAAIEIYEFLNEYFPECFDDFLDENIKTKRKIKVLGANTDFDVQFIRHFLLEFQIPFPYHHILLDIQGVFYGLFNIYKTEDIFNQLEYEKRGNHDALNDAFYTLEAFKFINDLVKGGL